MRKALEVVNALLAHRGVLFIVDVHSGGTSIGVAVYRGRNQHAFSHFGGRLEQNRVQRQRVAVEQEVFALARMDGKGIVAHQARDCIGVNARGVDNAASGNAFFRCFQYEEILFCADVRNLMVQEQLRAPLARAFSAQAMANSKGQVMPAVGA